jgi:hypothetical protein
MDNTNIELMDHIISLLKMIIMQVGNIVVIEHNMKNPIQNIARDFC